MIKNNVFYFLLLTAFTTVPLLPIFAMETKISEEQLQWKITGDFDTKFERDPESNGLNRQVFITAVAENSYIKKITLRGHKNNNIAIWVEVTSFRDDIFNEIKTFANWFDWGKTFNSIVKSDLNKFLNAFYSRDLIPDFIIDRIIKDIGIEDFRMDGNRFIQLINQKINENSTADDFIMIVNEELQKIKNPICAQTIVWDLIRDLKDSEDFDKQTVISLCKMIHNPDLPFYAEVQIMRANLSRDPARIIGIVDRYKEPITLHLMFPKDREDMRAQLNVLVNGFYHNDAPGNELPDDLKDLSLSPESMFKLLNFIRQQKLELDRYVNNAK